MEAGEAFARSEIACEAFGALVNRAATLSMEGKASMWKRVKAAGSRTWEAIKEFFRKMIAYVTSFISGNVIMIKAKRLKKRMEDEKDDVTANISSKNKDETITSNYDTHNDFKNKLEKIEVEYKYACASVDKTGYKDKSNLASSGKSYSAIYTHGYGMKLNAYSKEKDLKKQSKTISPNGKRTNGWDDNMTTKSPTLSGYFASEYTYDGLLKIVTDYTTGRVKAMVFLKATVVPTLNKMYKLAEKYAKEAADNSKVAAFKDAQRATKRTVNLLIKQVQVEVSAIAKAIKEPSD